MDESNAIERIKISYKAPICELAYKTLNIQSKKHKKYSKLTHSIMNGFILSKLKDIRLKGSQRATAALMDAIKMPINKAEEIYKATGISAKGVGELIYRITKEYNLENLACFFGNLIYGGIIAPRNIYGYGVGAICFRESDEKPNANDWPDNNYILLNSHERRISRAVGEVDRLIAQGSGIIAICGDIDHIFAKEMLLKYKNEPDIAFILIETPKPSEKAEIAEGVAAYPSHLFSSIDKLNNIMVIISEAMPGPDETKRAERMKYKSPCGKSTWHERKLRALASYGILHGELECGTVGGADRSTRFGAPLFSFRQELSLESSELCDKATSFLARDTWHGAGKESVDLNIIKDLLGILPREVSELVRSPNLPIMMPGLFELLSVLQYFSTHGHLSSVNLTIL